MGSFYLDHESKKSAKKKSTPYELVCHCRVLVNTIESTHRPKVKKKTGPAQQGTYAFFGSRKSQKPKAKSCSGAYLSALGLFFKVKSQEVFDSTLFFRDRESTCAAFL